MTWRLPTDVAYVEGDDETTWVVTVSNGTIHGLTPTGTTIWLACDGAGSADEVVDTLSRELGWDADEIRAHVEEFVENLFSKQLIVKASV